MLAVDFHDKCLCKCLYRPNNITNNGIGIANS